MTFPENLSGNEIVSVKPRIETNGTNSQILCENLSSRSMPDTMLSPTQNPHSVDGDAVQDSSLRVISNR